MSRVHHSANGEPSQRMLRVAELVRHAFSDLFARGDIDDPALVGRVVTATRVKMSPDLKLATVYVMPLGGEHIEKVVASLEKHRAYVRGEIARKINLKFTPDIRFRIDDDFEKTAQIEALLASDKVRRDLMPREEGIDLADKGGKADKDGKADKAYKDGKGDKNSD